MASDYEQGVDDTTKPVNVLHCVVVTPEETALEASAEFVALPMFDGEVGISPRRAPMIGRLGYGELRLREGDQTRRYYVDGGFVQVADNVVTILTGKAVPVADLDAEVAREQLDSARSMVANTEELLAVRDRQQQQARAQIQLAKKAGS